MTFYPPPGPIYPSLRGRRALVIGGSRGIGQAIALRLAGEGVHLIATYVRDEPAALETVARCRVHGVEALAIKADIGDAEARGDLFRQIASWRPDDSGAGLDILVNNAARGLERPRDAVAQRHGHLRRTMDVNLFGPWAAVQAAVPLMEARGGGSVVNLLSPGADHYMPDYAAVGVSKAALASLTMYLATELAPRRIRVNAVSAGWVEGSAGDRTYRTEVPDAIRPFVPAGRNVAPEDVAAAVAWICSDQAPMLIGQTIFLDGGFTSASWAPLLRGEDPQPEA